MEHLTGLLQALAGALRIPVALYKNGSIYYPEHTQLKTVSSEILREDPLQDIPRERNRPRTVQYVSTPYKEHFVYCCEMPNYELFIGPVVLEPIREGYAAEIISRHGLPQKKKGALVDFYAQLPLITEAAYYYIGSITQQLLFTGEVQNLPAQPDVQIPPAEPVFSARGVLDERFRIFEHPPYFMELEMTRLIQTGNVHSALKTMGRINTFERAVLASNPVRSMKNSLICNCAIFARAAISGGISSDAAFSLSDRIINQIEGCNALLQLVELEKQSLIEFVTLVFDFNNQRYSAPIREVMGYIDYHLSEKLELKQLAKLVYLNPNYLSTLFHKETDTTISHYIIVRRVEEAKFLLRNTSNSISDIAGFYQFCSQSHFIKCFRDIVGQTPLQYRKHTGSDLSLATTST